MLLLTPNAIYFHNLPAVRPLRCYSQGLTCAYAVVMLLVLLLLLCTWRNCPAGLCAFSFLLNVLLIIFCLLPLVYTVAIIALRDGCANVENILTTAITNGDFGLGNLNHLGAGGSNSTGQSPILVVVDYYLGDPNVSASESPAQVLSAVVDINGLKSEVNSSVSNALADIQGQYTFRTSVS